MNHNGHLTPRETEVLRLVAGGLEYKQMADGLGVSIWTAKHHMANIRLKLGAYNRTHAVAIAKDKGLI